MALEAHLKELASRHSDIDDKIRDIQKTPAPDEIEVSKLKKEKLRLKDEIASLKMQAEA